MIKLQGHKTLYASLLAGLLAIATLTHTATVWHNDWQLSHAELPESAPLANETADLIAAIPNLHLFGQSMTTLGNIPITNLPLRLTGIVKIDGDSAASKAYIATEGQMSNIVQLGDTLPNGVKVHDIQDDSVILDHQGHLEKLPLARERLVFQSSNEEATH